MWTLLLAALTLTAAPAPAQQETAAVTPAAAVSAPAGSKVWLDHYAEFEDFLKTAEIEKIDTIPIGVTKPRRAFFKPGGVAASAAVKNLKPGRQQGYWESYKSEIAAYELDKLLGMGMVPPTVEKRVDGDLQSMQLWVENTVWLKTKKGQIAPNVIAWNRQVYRQRVFDNLTANIDRNEGNLLVDPDWNLVLIDHSRAFTTETKTLFPMTRIDRPFFEKLKALDEATLKEKLGPWVQGGNELKALLKRRDAIVAQFEKLAKEKSEAEVFVP